MADEDDLMLNIMPITPSFALPPATRPVVGLGKLSKLPQAPKKAPPAAPKKAPSEKAQKMRLLHKPKLSEIADGTWSKAMAANAKQVKKELYSGKKTAPTAETSAAPPAQPAAPKPSKGNTVDSKRPVKANSSVAKPTAIEVGSESSADEKMDVDPPAPTKAAKPALKKLQKKADNSSESSDRGSSSGSDSESEDSTEVFKRIVAHTALPKPNNAGPSHETPAPVKVAVPDTKPKVQEAKKAKATAKPSPAKAKAPAPSPAPAHNSIKAQPVIEIEEKSFQEMGLNSYLLANLTEKMQLTKPTRVQMAAIPEVMKKRDVLIKAPTGSGKTLAYLVPVLDDLIKLQEHIARKDGTFALIIVPTRELSIQIYEVMKQVLRPFPKLVPGIIMGGEKRKSEKARLRKGVTVLVCTPGRLLDHFDNTSAFSMPHLRWLILDEADRLLDMGFDRDITRILSLLKLRAQPDIKRHSLLVSATLNKKVESLVALSLTEPVFVNLDSNHGGRAASAFTKPVAADCEAEAPEEEDSLELVPGEYSADEEEEAPKMSASQLADKSHRDRVQDELEEEIGRAHEIPANLTQHSMIVNDKRKLIDLVAFLRLKILSQPVMKIVVFLASCEVVEYFYTLLSLVELPTKLESAAARKKRKAAAAAAKATDAATSMDAEEVEMQRLLPCSLFKLHGSLAQDVRTSTFHAFSKADSAVLFTTDVLARGIDVPAIDWIVQYDIPSDPAAYIHRIGRTARLDRKGDALLILLPSEQPYIDTLTKQKMMSFNRMDEADVLGTLRTNLKANPENDPAFESGLLQYHLEQVVERTSHVNLKLLGIKAFQSFIRAYATHSRSTKKIFHIKNLHLGHLARNFALKEPPSQFNHILYTSAKNDKKKRDRPSQPGEESDAPAAKRRKLFDPPRDPLPNSRHFRTRAGAGGFDSSALGAKSFKGAAKAAKAAKATVKSLKSRFNPIDEFAA